MMPNYMLLLYAPETDEAGQAERWAELPKWRALIDELQNDGVMIANAALHGTESATTVRVRDDEAEMTDGPFAATKEVLVGYFLLDCPDLDQALKAAQRIPNARYGSVEVRPVMDVGEYPQPDQAAAESP
jgi:hypothetical protein